MELPQPFYPAFFVAFAKAPKRVGTIDGQVGEGNNGRDGGLGFQGEIKKTKDSSVVPGKVDLGDLAQGGKGQRRGVLAKGPQDVRAGASPQGPRSFCP